ncbi:hypothetical protein LguiB_031906 [Lonicera macranthoides]
MTLEAKSFQLVWLGTTMELCKWSLVLPGHANGITNISYWLNHQSPANSLAAIKECNVPIANICNPMSRVRFFFHAKACQLTLRKNQNVRNRSAAVPAHSSNIIRETPPDILE